MDSLVPFLTARWKNLALINFAVDPALLDPYLPQGTELDTWQGTTYLSLVGFLFLDTRVLGFSVPFHRNFEEVNLRFYVRRNVGGEWRRGVVFIKEVVPRWALSFVARWVYNENYVTLPMSHEFQYQQESQDCLAALRYSWGTASSLRVEVDGTPSALIENSEEEFITEHYWGYTKQRNGSTLEYRVAHPRWRVWRSSGHTLSGDTTELYGPKFGAVLRGVPRSAFVAEGSEITVFRGVTIDL